MSNLNDEDGNEIGQPKLSDMSNYEQTIEKTNELYNDFIIKYCSKKHEFGHTNSVYSGIYFCSKRLIEAEEKHKDEITKLNMLIDKLAEEIRRNSGDCKFCGLNNDCPCGNKYDHDFCPTPVLSRYNILKHFMK